MGTSSRDEAPPVVDGGEKRRLDREGVRRRARRVRRDGKGNVRIVISFFWARAMLRARAARDEGDASQPRRASRRLRL